MVLRVLSECFHGRLLGLGATCSEAVRVLLQGRELLLSSRVQGFGSGLL